MVVVIDDKLCNGLSACHADGICVEVCALNAMGVVEGMPVVLDNCVDCGLCVMNCPREAISKQ